jgi:hypothetical protein
MFRTREFFGEPILALPIARPLHQQIHALLVWFIGCIKGFCAIIEIEPMLASRW